MLEKLAAIEAKYSQIEARLAAPETYDDPAAVARLNKEQNELSPVVETYRSYLAARERLAQAEELLSDPEMRELAQEELLQTNAELERLEGQLQLLLLPKDPNDNKNVIVEIRAGVGGEEAALFAHSLYRMYSMYAERSRWKTEVDSLSETELGGIKEISFTIEGEGAWSRLKFEIGVHRVQRVPETEPGGRVHTSTATVAVLPEMETVDVQLNPADVEIREGESPLEFTLWGRSGDGQLRELPRQELLLLTPFQPAVGSPYGVSLLRSMPYLTGILLNIYQAMGMNWERMGNVRFAVVYKPGDAPLEQSMAQERSRQIAREWSAAMEAGRDGRVRDFVAVGDVDIKVIGADNQVLDSEVPVRQILEQLVARTGIPPFLLGLSWSSTERMSTQQADLLTSEITAIRRSVEPALERIGELWVRLHGFGGGVRIDWEDINLQDIVEEARAELYRAQAEEIRRRHQAE